MERQSVERGMAGVEEGDHGRRIAEMAPGRLDHMALPPRLFGGHRGIAALAKFHRPGAARVCRGRAGGIGAAHVTDPGSAGPAPSASRVRAICSEYSRANCSWAAFSRGLSERSALISESWCRRSKLLRSMTMLLGAVSGSASRLSAAGAYACHAGRWF